MGGSGGGGGDGGGGGGRGGGGGGDGGAGGNGGACGALSAHRSNVPSDCMHVLPMLSLQDTCAPARAHEYYSNTMTAGGATRYSKYIVDGNGDSGEIENGGSGEAAIALKAV